ncbi:MAG: class I SAM-dependent methyltransferase [Myxococcales bacterium]
MITGIISADEYGYGGELDWDASYTAEQLKATRAFRNATGAFQRILAEVERFGASLPSPLRFHDIGCSEGFFLFLGAQRGWTCTGNDLSDQRRRFGQRNLGVDFSLGLFRDTGPEKVDVAMMRHVLEHLPDPAGELKLVLERLSPGGLFLVEVPNFSAPTIQMKVLRQRMGLRRGSLSFLGVPEHLWQFNQATIRLLLERAGFEVLNVSTTSRYLNHSRPIRWLQRQTLHRARLGSHLCVAARRPA